MVNKNLKNTAILTVILFLISPFLPWLLTPISMIPAAIISLPFIGDKCRNAGEMCGMGEYFVVIIVLNFIIATLILSIAYGLLNKKQNLTKKIISIILLILFCIIPNLILILINPT
jgi:hypothetical protein